MQTQTGPHESRKWRGKENFASCGGDAILNHALQLASVLYFTRNITFSSMVFRTQFEDRHLADIRKEEQTATFFYQVSFCASSYKSNDTKWFRPEWVAGTPSKCIFSLLPTSLLLQQYRKKEKTVLVCLASTAKVTVANVTVVVFMYRSTWTLPL